MKYKATISNDELSALPQGAFGGKIVVVDSAEMLDMACSELSRARVIGFDTETRPSFKKGVINKMALLQLSCEGKAFLIRLNKIKLSKEIVAILESEKHIKVGASIRDDIKGIQKNTPFTPSGFADLQTMVGRYGIEDISVRKLCAIVLGIRISKAQRLSNWEAQVLTDSQQTYAATDAWSCREIYLKLTKE